MLDAHMQTPELASLQYVLYGREVALRLGMLGSASEIVVG